MNAMNVLLKPDGARLHGNRAILRGPFQPYGDRGWIANGPPGGDDESAPSRSQFQLHEDDRPLSGHQLHWTIARVGAGRFSHWYDSVYFSTADGSNPNTNGRTYSFDFSLDFDAWNRQRLTRSAQRWKRHPQGEFVLARGGDLVPPPLACNIALTNKCNLRCEICGSQKFLDESGVARRNTQLDRFEAIAAAVFPFMSIVELNSQGDPLLHPHIETVIERIGAHGCDIKVQHNGTLLSDRIVDLLLRQHGEIMLSLDAVGEKFDEVRRGGVWAKAAPGLDRLLRERDPARLSIGVYPTLTRRTIGEAMNVVEWSAERGVDLVAFHRYVPILNSFEEAPRESEYDALKTRLRRWCADQGNSVRVLFESELLNATEPASRRTEFASLEKMADVADFPGPNFPTDEPGDPVLTCPSPRDYVEIGLEGQISTCCRAQDVSLGLATSIESFAEAWLGMNYDRIRRSLTRGATGSYPLPNCESCMQFFAPKSAGTRRAVDYLNGAWRQDGLVLQNSNEIRIEGVRKELGHCFIGMLSPGLDVSAFELWEDEKLLGPGDCLHDDIRQFGAGRYSIGPRAIYFSASDGTSPQRNQRTYSLRPKMAMASSDPLDQGQEED